MWLNQDIKNKVKKKNQNISSTNKLLHQCLDRFSEEAKDSKKSDYTYYHLWLLR